MEQIVQLFTKRSPLVVLAFGVILTVLAASEKIMISGNGLEISEESIILLWMISIYLIVFSVYLMLKTDSFSKPNKSTPVKYSDSWNRKAFLEQGEELNKLDRMLANVRNQIEGSNDATAKALMSSLTEIETSFERYRDRAKYVKSIIEWIEHHQDLWMNKLKMENYKQDFNNRRSEFREFKLEVLKLIDVLKESVEKGAYIQPSKVGIDPGKLENLTPYKKALIEIRRQMERDLDNTDTELLGGEERYILQSSMEGLIARF